MATLSGRCSSMMEPRRSKIIASRRAMGSRGESLMAPQVRQTRLSLGPSSTTPKPVYSVPQSTPRTRMRESLSQFKRFTVANLDGGRASSPVLSKRRSGERSPCGDGSLTRPHTEPTTFGGRPSSIQLLAAPRAACFCDFMLPAEGGVGIAGRYQMLLVQKARIRGFVENLAQRGGNNGRERPQAFGTSQE